MIIMRLNGLSFLVLICVQWRSDAQAPGTPGVTDKLDNTAICSLALFDVARMCTVHLSKKAPTAEILWASTSPAVTLNLTSDDGPGVGGGANLKGRVNVGANAGSQTGVNVGLNAGGNTQVKTGGKTQIVIGVKEKNTTIDEKDFKEKICDKLEKPALTSSLEACKKKEYRDLQVCKMTFYDLQAICNFRLYLATQTDFSVKDTSKPIRIDYSGLAKQKPVSFEIDGKNETMHFETFVYQFCRKVLVKPIEKYVYEDPYYKNEFCKTYEHEGY